MISKTYNLYGESLNRTEKNMLKGVEVETLSDHVEIHGKKLLITFIASI